MKSMTISLDDYYMVTLDEFCLNHGIAGKDKDDLEKLTRHLSTKETEKTWAYYYIELLTDTFIQGKLL